MDVTPRVVIIHVRSFSLLVANNVCGGRGGDFTYN